MCWRQVGPFRGGRVLAVTGVEGEPNVFYFGAAAGGIWKTTDEGANWRPISDKQPNNFLFGVGPRQLIEMVPDHGKKG